MKELTRFIKYISLPLGFIGFIFPVYALSLGVDVIQMGLLYSIFSIIGILIRPLVGNLIDKKGRKIGIILGSIFYSLVNLIFLLANDFKYLLIGRILQSFGAAFLWITVDTVVSDISNNKNRSQHFGLINQNISKAGFIGSLIGFTILFNNYSQDPFRLIFIIFLFTSSMGIYYGSKKVPETIDLKKDLEEGSIRNREGLFYFLSIMGLLSLISSLTAPIYLLYLQDNITNDLSLILYLFIPSTILSTFLPKKLGVLSDNYSKEKIIIIGVFINSILQILIPLNRSYYGFMIIYSLISIVVMFYSPALSSLVIDYVGENKRGRSYGLYSFSNGLGDALGPILGSYIYKNIGNHRVFFIKGGLMLIMTLLISIFYIKEIRRLGIKRSLE